MCARRVITACICCSLRKCKYSFNAWIWKILNTKAIKIYDSFTHTHFKKCSKYEN
jgi:hypothetical protein